MPIVIKSARDLQAMRDAAKINVEALQAVSQAVEPGVTTAALDKIAHDIITGYGATPAFLGYPPGSKYPYPATITASVNQELVHGIPSEEVHLQAGDIISLDCGTVHHGFVADSALTVPVGSVSEDVQKLLDVTEQSLYIGIDQCIAGNRFGDVSAAIQRFVEDQDLNVVREYGGHGVGRQMHEDPHIPNWGTPGRGQRLRPGMTFALEPMVMLGGPKVKTLDDHWTVVTVDGKWCAHFEHTVAVTSNGPEILTAWD